MTAQIRVIDISDNNNDNTDDVSGEAPTETSTTNIALPEEVVKQKEVKPKVKSQRRANVKAKDKGEIRQEKVKQEEVNQEEVKQEVVKQEEVKPKYRNRPELKEKATCADCGKELTVHGLKYTHKRY